MELPKNKSWIKDRISGIKEKGGENRIRSDGVYQFWLGESLNYNLMRFFDDGTVIFAISIFLFKSSDEEAEICE